MTDLGIAAAMSGGLIVVDDLDGAIDTSGITWTDIVAAIVVMIVTVVLAVLLSHVSARSGGKSVQSEARDHPLSSIRLPTRSE